MIFWMIRIILCLSFFLAFSGVSTVRAQQDSVFTVSDIKVDVTADSAAAAREKAISEAQVQAFTKLATRLVPEGEMAKFKIPDEPVVIAAMVRDFEVTDEQLSSVRYIGNYTVRFDESAVKSFLSRTGITYTDIGSKPVLILPYFKSGNRTVLWGDDNPWLAAWSRATSSGGDLVPVTVPIGDAQDVSDIGSEELMEYDSLALSNMAERYNAGEAIFMVAEFRDQGDLVVSLYRTDRGRPELSGDFSINTGSAADAIVIFDMAVERARREVQGDWKMRTAAPATAGLQSETLQARARFSSLQEWASLQKSLRRAQGIESIRILTLKPDQAIIELVFKGGVERLRLALEQSDLILIQSAVSPYEGQIFDNIDTQPVYEISQNRPGVKLYP